MAMLILGLGLWYAAHFFKRAAPGPRSRLGEPGKGLVAVLVLGAVVLMVIGYRDWAAPQVWLPPPFTVHINNLLVIVAFYLYAASGTKAWIATQMRHPQLTGFALWAAAHLLVNGDLASIVLFGALLVWAVGEMIVINRAEPVWTPPVWKGRAAEFRAVVGTVVVVAVVATIHTWLGYWPFPG